MGYHPTVLVGDTGVLVVDAPRDGWGARIIQAIRGEITDLPRWIGIIGALASGSVRLYTARGLSSPIFLIRDASVVGFTPSKSAAPPRP